MKISSLPLEHASSTPASSWCRFYCLSSAPAGHEPRGVRNDLRATHKVGLGSTHVLLEQHIKLHGRFFVHHIYSKPRKTWLTPAVIGLTVAKRKKQTAPKQKRINYANLNYNGSIWFCFFFVAIFNYSRIIIILVFAHFSVIRLNVY